MRRTRAYQHTIYTSTAVSAQPAWLGGHGPERCSVVPLCVSISCARFLRAFSLPWLPAVTMTNYSGRARGEPGEVGVDESMVA